MIAHQVSNCAAIEKVVNVGVAVEQGCANIVYALTPKPARVRCGEALLAVFNNFGRDEASHCLSQDELAIAGFREIGLAFSTRIVLVHSHNFAEVAQLHPNRQVHCEISKVIVKKGNPRLNGMRHRELVLHYQEAVEECFGLKVKRTVDVILRTPKLHPRTVEHIAKNVSSIKCFYVRPNWLEHAPNGVIGNKPLPEIVVPVDVLLEVRVNGGSIIAPRIASKEFISACA